MSFWLGARCPSRRTGFREAPIDPFAKCSRPARSPARPLAVPDHPHPVGARPPARRPVMLRVHQSRSIAGFHLLGVEPVAIAWTSRSADVTALPCDLARRAQYVVALGRGTRGRRDPPSAERDGDDGYGARCGRAILGLRAGPVAWDFAARVLTDSELGFACLKWVGRRRCVASEGSSPQASAPARRHSAAWAQRMLARPAERARQIASVSLRYVRRRLQ